MAARARPTVKGVYVSHDVVTDAATGKPTLVGVWGRTRVPAGASFPYTFPQVCATVVLAGGTVDVTLRVEVVNATTGDAIHRSVGHVCTFPNRLRPVLAAVRLRPLTVPAAGVYLIEFWCDGVFLDDQRVEVVA